MKKVLFGFALVALTMPSIAFAQLGNVENILTSIGNLISKATPIVVGLALLAFFWGLATFIFSAGNDDAKDRGKNIMIWGIVALFVMVSVWGIVRFIGQALGINQGDTIIVPQVPR